MALLLALTAGASALSAQEAAPAAKEAKDEIVELEAFTVTGIRASVSTAIETKRESINMVDSIHAEDIGKFPDNNVVEALQRLPGIQVTDRSSGQVASLTIRGLPDVSTTMNGRNIFTASGQSFSLQDIPAAMLGSVDVYKTRSADLLEYGLAGQLDVHTHRPFDFKGEKFNLGVRYIYSDLGKDMSPVASMLYSNRWKTSAGKFGALVNLSYSDISYRNQSITAGAMVPFLTDVPAVGWVPYQRVFPDSGAWTPGLENGLSSTAGSTFLIGGVQTPYLLGRDAVFASDATGKTKRPAVNAALQWAPNDSSEYTFEVFYNRFENENFNSLLFSFADWWGGPHGAVTTFPGTNIIKERASTANVYTFNSGDLAWARTDTYMAALNGKWTISPDFKLKADVSYQDSKYKNDFIAMRIDRVAPTLVVDFNDKDGLPAFAFPGTDLLDPNIWNTAQTYDNSGETSGSAYTGTVDGTYSLGIPVLKNIKFGLRHDSRKASESSRDGFDRYYQVNAATIPGLLSKNSNFFDGRANVPDSWLVPDGYYLREHREEIRTLWGRTGNALIMKNNFNVKEDTSSAYLMSTYETSIGGHKLDGQFGVRYSHIGTSLDFLDETGTTPTRSNKDTSTQKLLPSGSLRFDLTEKLRFRATYGETLRRPNFADLNPTIRKFEDVTNIGYGTASSGNPNLRATHSRNYDAALEYYFDSATAVYVTGFRRDIDGLVLSFKNPVTLYSENFGRDYTYIMSQPDNASDGVLYGAEIGGSFFPKNLPGILDGFGLMASYTKLKSQQDIPLVDSTGKITGTKRTEFYLVSPDSYNVTVAYEKKKFSARLSYQWRSEFRHHDEAALFANPLGVFNSAEKALDLGLTYKVNDKLTLTLDATNLTNEIYKSHYGDGANAATTNNFGNWLVSRTVAVGVRYGF